MAEILVRKTESEFTALISKLKLCPCEKFLELCKNEARKIYPIREKGDRPRLALIICNTEFDHLPRHNGSNHDINVMKVLLENLGYCVHVEEKLTARDMELVLKIFAARREHRSSDRTFLVFMSHGTLDRICGTLDSDENSDMLSYDTIFQIFNNRNCCSLKDKPKVIIIQACRGDKLLIRRRRLFIHSVSEEGTINGLLDDLLEDRVISQEEMNKVRDENDTVMDKARVLIDLVIGKGCRACKKFIKHLREEDPELAYKLRLFKERRCDGSLADY